MQRTKHGRAALAAAGTATIWAGSTGRKWKVLEGVVSWRGLTVTGGIMFLDSATEIFRVQPQATSGSVFISFGVDGYPATTTATHFNMETESSGAAWATFVGSDE